MSTYTEYISDRSKPRFSGETKTVGKSSSFGVFERTVEHSSEDGSAISSLTFYKGQSSYFDLRVGTSNSSFVTETVNYYYCAIGRYSLTGKQNFVQVMRPLFVCYQRPFRRVVLLGETLFDCFVNFDQGICLPLYSTLCLKVCLSI